MRTLTAILIGWVAWAQVAAAQGSFYQRPVVGVEPVQAEGVDAKAALEHSTMNLVHASAVRLDRAQWLYVGEEALKEGGLPGDFVAAVVDEQQENTALHRWVRAEDGPDGFWESPFLVAGAPELLVFRVSEEPRLVGVVYRFLISPRARMASADSEFLQVQVVDEDGAAPVWTSRPIHVGFESWRLPPGETDEEGLASSPEEFLALSTDLLPAFFAPDEMIDMAPVATAGYGSVVRHQVLVADLNDDGFADLAVHQRRYRGARPGEPTSEEAGLERFVLQDERMLALLFDPESKRFEDPVQDPSLPLPEPSCCPEAGL